MAQTRVESRRQRGNCQSQVARGERFVDPTINSFHAKVSVNEDRTGPASGIFRATTGDAASRSSLKPRCERVPISKDHSRVCNALNEAQQFLRCPRLKSITVAPRSASGKSKDTVLRPTKNHWLIASLPAPAFKGIYR